LASVVIHEALPLPKNCSNSVADTDGGSDIPNIWHDSPGVVGVILHDQPARLALGVPVGTAAKLSVSPAETDMAPVSDFVASSVPV